jgi:hypothetical protein
MAGIADFVVKLGLNTKTFHGGIEDAKKDVQSLTATIDSATSRIGGAFSKLKSFGGVIRGGVLGGILFGEGKFIHDQMNAVLEKAKEIKRGTAETGFDAGTFQRVGNVLGKNDIGEGEMGKSLKDVAEAMDKIRSGEDTGGKLAADFAELGVSLDDIKRKNHQQVWLEIAENMKHAEMNARKLTALGNVMGGKAFEMLPAFREGFDSAAANRGVLSDEDLEKAARYKQLIGGINSVWTDFKNNVGSIGLGAANWVANLFGAGGGNGATNPNQSAMEARLAAIARDKAMKQAKAAEADTIRKQLAPKMKEIQDKIEAEQEKMATPSARRGMIEGRLAKLYRERAGLTGTGPEDDLKREQNRLAILQTQDQLRTVQTPGLGLSVRTADTLGRQGLFSGGENAAVQIELQQQNAMMREQVRELQSAVRELRQLNRNLTSTDVL